MKMPHSTIVRLFSEKNSIDHEILLKKYLRWHCKSFTDDNRMVRWCPYTKDCNYAVERISAQDSIGSIINCLCGNSFCFKCGNEQHWPADCEMYKKWQIKCSAESENLTWILANTKMCPNPKCQRPIEKSTGCNHMTCKVCAFEFCWMCSEPWKNHNQSTGGYYKCNKYEEIKDTDDFKSKNKKSEDAKAELNRYIFYYERFENHRRAEKLVREIKPVILLKTKMLHDMKGYPQKELEFLVTAVEEIARCRQVLKFTYCYGYLAGKMSKTQKGLFEH